MLLGVAAGRLRRTVTLAAWLLANVLVGLLWGYTGQVQLECRLPPAVPFADLGLFPCSLVPLGLALTVPMALLQFAAVRTGLGASWWWVPVTALAGLLLFQAGYGAAFALLFLVSLVSRVAVGFVALVAPVVAGLAAGTVVGAAQAAALPGRVPDRWMWAMASSLGAALSLPLWLLHEPGPAVAGLVYGLPGGYLVYRWVE